VLSNSDMSKFKSRIVLSSILHRFFLCKVIYETGFISHFLVFVRTLILLPKYIETILNFGLNQL